MSEVSLRLFGLTIVSAVYWLVAIVVASPFGRRRVHSAGFYPPVTVPKPLCGADRISSYQRAVRSRDPTA